MKRKGWKPTRRFVGKDSPLVGKRKRRIGARAFMSPKAAIAKMLFSENCKTVSIPQALGKAVLEKHMVFRDGKGRVKGLIARTNLFGNPYSEDWVYYPRPFYMPLFDKASEHVRSGGPASFYPGSV